MDPVSQVLHGFEPEASHRLTHDLYVRLRAAIEEGRLADGLLLPSSRSLAKLIGISRNTAIAVYDRLINEGFARTRPGSGCFVVRPSARQEPPSISSEDRHRHLAPLWRHAAPIDTPATRGPLDLTPGTPDTSAFPTAHWRRLCARAHRLTSLDQAYGETQGRLALRRSIAAHLSVTRALACTADDVIVTNGAQQALDLLARILVTPAESVVAVENPGYTFAHRAFAQSGAHLIPVPVDEEGMNTDALPTRVDIFLVSPSHHFPLGVAMSPPRRRSLLQAAYKRNALIIEDDYQADFPIPGKPADALTSLDRRDSVFYVGTFSKSMFPALRLGFIVTPLWAREAIICAKQLTCHETAPFEQDALAAFLDEGGLRRHVRRMRTLYARKRAAMANALTRRASGWIDQIHAEGGAHMWCNLREEVSAEAIAAQARHNGVRVIPLAPFHIAPPFRNGLVLGLGRIPLDRIVDAAEVLARAAKEAPRR